MDQRLKLQERLVELLGLNHVYFQPPPSIQMSYPCIVYNLDDIDIRHADNRPYKNKRRYRLTVMDRDPDSSIPDKVAQLPSSSFNRFFAIDNLNHFVFTIFF